MFLKLEAALLQFFYLAHWVIPWFILLVGMYMIVKFVRGYLDRLPFTDNERKYLVAFRYLMTMQGVTGIVYFVWSGLLTQDFPVYRIAHGVMMFIAAMILRFAPRAKSADDATLYLNNFYVLLFSFLIMLVGLGLVPASTTGR